MKLILGDCLEEMKKMPDNSIDLVLTDPPYGTTACKWDSIIPLEPMWEQLKRIAKPNSAIIMTASQPFTSTLIMSNIKIFKYELIWDRNYCGSPGVAKYRPMPTHESILVFCGGVTTYNPQMLEGKPYKDIRKNAGAELKSNEHKFGYKVHQPVINKGTRYPKSVLFVQKHNKKGQHPTQKPVALMEYLIKTYTNEGETVLDFTMGSGTTGVACVNTNRDFIGIELNEEYYKIAEKRINQTVGSLF